MYFKINDDVNSIREHHMDMNRKSTTWGLAPLGSVIPKSASPAMRRRGFAHSSIITHWSDIVGEKIGDGSCPEKLSFSAKEGSGGTLTIRVEGGLALELQHLEPVLIERINQFFGYNAVNKIKILQGFLPKTAKKPLKSKKKLSKEEVVKIDKIVQDTDNKELRKALRSLGEDMLKEKPS